MALSALGQAMAVTDCSDGLVVSCDLLANGLGYELTAADLPVDPAARQAAWTAEQAEAWALNGGEDYELVLAFPPESESAVRHAVAPLALVVVGRLSAAPGQWLLRSDGRRPLDRSGGFRHF